MYEALSAYHEFETWKVLPYPGGLYDQPYEWKMGVECVRAAHALYQREQMRRREKASAEG